MSEAMLDAVAEGLRFIEENLYQEIGVSDVANAAAYSPFYFSREFSRHARISVYDYILKRKLSQSYKDLFSRRYKIVELAFRYGFQSHEVYTRAFRKLFGENPSEASVYKPMAVYEPIGEAYLMFLSGLRVETGDRSVSELRFEVSGAASGLEAGSSQDFLIVLAPDTRCSCQGVLRGRIQENESGLLSVRLRRMRHILRIHHTDLQFAFRYYSDHFHDGDTLGGNYIFLQAGKAHIDILIPGS